jgi:hypothetical protein
MIITFLATACVYAAEKPKQEPIVLFDGKTLDGWFNHGGGNFSVQDGAIVGETAAGLPNSFLATKAVYRNFVLELEFKVDPALNSGVQFRSNVYQEETQTDRFAGRYDENGTPIVQRKTWPKGRFWGYQVEIDPSDRAWTGCIYEEGGRGFLHPPQNAEQHKDAFHAGGWNHFRIEANGGRIRSWLNGVLVADIYDTLTAEGHVALQLHGIGRYPEKAGKKVQWRRIALTPIPSK